jgi:purine NTPase
MEQFKIKEIRFSNFKRFREETEIDISQYDTIIFGGKNGFGKTTLFDAIELVLTGKIKRYEGYANSYTDKRQSYSDVSKPLVCDNSEDVVKVELLIEKAGNNYWLMRKAFTSEMTNPISFTPFGALYRKNENKEKYTKINEEAVSQCNFLHYLDQEESTLFLKSKVKDRSNDINSLFNIETLEKIIDRAKNSSKQLGLIKREYNNGLQDIN